MPEPSVTQTLPSKSVILSVLTWNPLKSPDTSSLILVILLWSLLGTILVDVVSLLIVNDIMGGMILFISKMLRNILLPRGRAMSLLSVRATNLGFLFQRDVVSS